jgi:hypothetical protein
LDLTCDSRKDRKMTSTMIASLNYSFWKTVYQRITILLAGNLK